MVPEIIQVSAEKPVGKLGLQPGDRIIEADGKVITHSQQFVDIIKSNADKEFSLRWIRNGNEMSGSIKPDPADSTIGVNVFKYTGSVKNIKYNVFTAVPEGFKDLWDYGVVLFLKSIGK